MNRISLFNPEDNPEETSNRLKALDTTRPFWVHRRLHHPFFTLGAAAYLDAAKGSRVPCDDKRARTTGLIEATFGPLLESVRVALQSSTGRPCRHDPAHYAYPGFHIYEAHPDFARDVAKIHCDRQYEGLDWRPSMADSSTTENLSFTLTFELHTGGTGIYFWPISYRHDVVERRGPVSLQDREFHPCAPGELVLHSGDHVHRAVSRRDPEATGRRVTLQGHATDAHGPWVLYW